MRRLALFLLCGFLVTWEPLRVATEWQASAGSLSMRGAPAVLELVLHTLIAAFSVAAAIALWNDSPAGVTFAAIALVASAAVSIQSLYFSSLPHQTAPGQRLPLAALAIVVSAVSLYALHRMHKA